MGQLRWEGIDGRKHVQAGRLTWLTHCWSEGVISGTGRAYEIRLGERRPWHAIEATTEEMRSVLLSRPPGSRSRLNASLVERCDRVRVTRVMRGLAVFP